MLLGHGMCTAAKLVINVDGTEKCASGHAHMLPVALSTSIEMDRSGPNPVTQWLHGIKNKKGYKQNML